VVEGKLGIDLRVIQVHLDAVAVGGTNRVTPPFKSLHVRGVQSFDELLPTQIPTVGPQELPKFIQGHKPLPVHGEIPFVGGMTQIVREGLGESGFQRPSFREYY
jgi:hypothetical protein